MIKIKDLCFSYNNSKPYIIDNLSLNIAKESYVSIIGANGSCKSTLIKLILNLLTPQKGSINLTSKKIGYVPQIVENFNSSFPITVWEMLNAHRNVLKIKDKESITEALKKVDMLEYKNSLIGNLSGGQKQKIILARILFRNTKMLLLDEPTSALDSLSETKIIDNLLKKSIPCILVSHKANLVKRFDKIIVISSGTIMECGNHESLIKKQGIYAEMFAAEKE